MAITRRALIGGGLGIAAWPQLRVSAAQNRLPSPPAGAPDDERFWTDVRAQFELDADRVNFVTVV
jgi:hypothetical protein